MEEEKCYRHEIEIPVRFTDIDLLAHVSNSCYSAMLDDGRLSYFRKLAGESFDPENISFVLVNLNLNFVTPAFLFDMLKIRTRTVRIGTKSVQMEQEIIRTADNDLICSSTSTLVGYNKRTKISHSIEPEWVERFEQFEGRKLK